MYYIYTTFIWLTLKDFHVRYIHLMQTKHNLNVDQIKVDCQISCQDVMLIVKLTV